MNRKYALLLLKKVLIPMEDSWKLVGWVSAIFKESQASHLFISVHASRDLFSIQA